MGIAADVLTADALDAPSSVIREILALVDTGDVLSLAGGMPDPATFPIDDLVAAAEAAFRAPSGAALQYGRTEGVPALRALVAELTGELRQRPTSADEVLITTGSQQALDLIGRACIEPGDDVAIDDPGYVGAIQAFGRQRPAWLPVPVDADGMDTDVLEASLRRGRRPKLVYTVTDFQNPTGAVLHPDRRRHLAALADHWGFVVVEDDPYGRIRFDEPEHPPVARWTDRAISLGTTSKTIAPGLRIGWAVAPADVTAALARIKQATDLHTSTTSQHMVLDLLSRPGWMDRRAGELARFYEPRARHLVETIRAAIPDAVTTPARGGLFLWLDLPGRDTAALLPRAVGAGVAFVPGSAFTTAVGPRSTARITYASLDEAGLSTAVRRLAGVL